MRRYMDLMNDCIYEAGKDKTLQEDLDYIANSEIDKNYGARPLRRKIQELVEDRLSEEILQGNIVRDKEFILKL